MESRRSDPRNVQMLAHSLTIKIPNISFSFISCALNYSINPRDTVVLVTPSESLQHEFRAWRQERQVWMSALQPSHSVEMALHCLGSSAVWLIRSHLAQYRQISLHGHI